MASDHGQEKAFKVGKDSFGRKVPAYRLTVILALWTLGGAL